MKYVILTVLLTIVYVVPLTPKQTTQNTSSSATKNEKKSTNSKNVSTPAPVQNEKNAPSADGNSEHPASQHDEQSRIVIDVERTAPRDKWDMLSIWLTVALVLVGFGTLGAVWYQAIQSRKAIMLQFRPKLIGRRIELEYGILQDKGLPAKIHYTIANVGGTNASNLHIRGTVNYENIKGFTGSGSNKRPMTPDAWSQTVDLADSVRLTAGEDRTVTLELDDNMFASVRFLHTMKTQSVTNPQLVGAINILAEIQYSDDLGITRKTGIRRELDIETMRFNPIPDSDYEYSD